MLIESDLARDSVEVIDAIRDLVSRTTPHGSKVLVAGIHPGLLGQLSDRRVLPFPTFTDGGEPSSSLAAIAHLTALEAQGAEYLLIPRSTLWWLDYYADLARHLDRRSRRVLAREDACFLYAVKERPDGDGISATLEGLIDAYSLQFDRDPALLDWDSGLDVASRFPELSVLSPLTRANILPYLDHTIDIVITADVPERHGEARRVAIAAIGIATPSEDERNTGAITLEKMGWSAGAPPAAVILHSSEIRTHDAVQALKESVPVDMPVQTLPELTLSQLGSETDILVFLDGRWRPLPGWFPSLVRTFRLHPEAGVVAGKLVDARGQLAGVGSTLAGTKATSEKILGEVEAPAVNVVRTIDSCSSTFLATRRELYEAWQERMTPAPPGEAYCRSVQSQGFSVLYQPLVTVVDTGAETDWLTMKDTP